MAHRTGLPRPSQGYSFRPSNNPIYPLPSAPQSHRFLSWQEDTPSRYDFGVYVLVLQHRRKSRRIATLYVGKGQILERLRAHLRNPVMRDYYGGPYHLRLWWASTGLNEADGIERYLADTLKPLEGQRYPLAFPISVNLPPF